MEVYPGCFFKKIEYKGVLAVIVHLRIELMLNPKNEYSLKLFSFEKNAILSKFIHNLDQRKGG